MDDRNLLHAFGVLEDWVDHGSRQGQDDDWDERLKQLERLLPESLKRSPEVVFRALVLDRSFLFKVFETGQAQCVDRIHASWTTSEDRARAFLRERIPYMKDGEVGVILRMPASLGRCVANVKDVYRAAGMNDPSVHSWTMYAQHENELIFFQGEEMTMISADRIVETCEKDDPWAMPPCVGDDVWFPEDEYPDVVTHVDMHQPDIDDGIWWVFLSGEEGRPVPVSWQPDLRCWDVCSPVPADIGMDFA